MSFRSLFRKLNVSRIHFNKLYDITKDKRLNVERNSDIKIEDRRLPADFIPRSKEIRGARQSPHRRHALNYLKKRNVTTNDILRYNIGYSESGEYQGRIIVPSYDSNKNLNFFSSRSFYDTSFMKYKNPDWSKDIIGFELFINWDETLTIVEGVFDALAIRRNVSPLFGKTMSYSLKEAIIRNGVSRVNIALDKDARRDALNIQNFLISQEVDVHLIKLEDKDPAVLGFGGMSNLIRDSKTTNFHDLVSMKLSG